MMKLVRDLMIILAMAHLIVGYYFVLDAKSVGYWKANVEIAYQSVMTEYWSDCDCTESLE